MTHLHAHPGKLNWRFGLLLLFWLVLGCTAWAQTAQREIGEAAKQAYEQQANQPKPQQVGTQEMKDLVGQVQLYVIIAIVLVLVLLAMVARLTDFNPFANVPRNAWNARVFVAFFIVSVLGLAYQYSIHAKYVLLNDAASAHGQELDDMLTTTLIITFIAFVITQTLLFGFAWYYQGKEGRVADYYHDNNKLEMYWTAIPAVVMAVLVLFGLRAWNNITSDAPPQALQVELIAEQFQWNIRYAGPNNTLGKSNYKLIGGKNFLGIDLSDANAKDDYVPADKEIVFPVNVPVNLNIRAKDVLHGVYMPHFRVQMYAVPGMPTKFTFTPTVTTAEMQKKTGNTEFQYELACSQLCGASHYNMRVPIRIVSVEEYKLWASKQTGYITPEMVAEAPVAKPAIASN